VSETPTVPDIAAVSLDETVIEEVAPAAVEHPRGVSGEVLLDVRGLRTSFRLREGTVRAVTGVDFSVRRGEVLGLVGESGCGKSVSSLSIMRLIAKPGVIEGGEVMFDGKDLLKLGESEMRSIRGNRISMIFQQPTSSLNPVLNVGYQIGEVLETHRQMKRRAARERALELMSMVGIPDPRRRLSAYPHEMSGGMAQRVMIAMALACEECARVYRPQSRQPDSSRPQSGGNPSMAFHAVSQLRAAAACRNPRIGASPLGQARWCRSGGPRRQRPGVLLLH
jgi:ABC-type lipoprotein export system ATPase subunit